MIPINLTEEEAQTLLDVAQLIGGPRLHSRRIHIDSIIQQLPDGMHPNCSDIGKGSHIIFKPVYPKEL